MTVKKPVRRSVSPTEPSKTLMGNQDLRHKGDSTSTRKKGKCITFWVTDEQKAEISAFAAEHNTTVSRLIVEGLELRMSRG
jgi:hypothetical protein